MRQKTYKDGAIRQDEDKIGDDEQLNFDKLEKRVNTVAGGSTGTVRNLRIREDTAKYLLNLDLESAYYDPKSRSMREDPTPGKPFHEKCYAGDNLIKSSGDELQEFKKLQLHLLEASKKGFAYIADAAPSQAEALFHKYKARKNKFQTDKMAALRLRYGNIASE